MVNIRLADGTDSAWAQAFGDFAETIIGCKAESLLDMYRKNDKGYKQALEKAKYKVSPTEKSWG